jgi:hypothetical protein
VARIVILDTSAGALARSEGRQMRNMVTSIPSAVRSTAIASGRQAAHALGRIRAEFMRIPNLCLTAADAAHLLGLPTWDCEFLLGGLVVNGFLRATPVGYVRS